MSETTNTESADAITTEQARALLARIDTLEAENKKLRGPDGDMITVEEQHRRWANELLGDPAGIGE